MKKSYFIPLRDASAFRAHGDVKIDKS